MIKNKYKNKLTLILLLFGVFLLILKGILPEKIDSNGILNEHFFLLPIGFGFIFFSIIIFIYNYIYKKLISNKSIK